MKKAILFTIFSLLCLSGCSFLAPVKNKNNNTYELAATPNLPTYSAYGRNKILVVSHPSSTNIYNTTQIAYTSCLYQTTYFAKSHWIDTPPNMLQQLIAQALQNTHYYKAVIPAPFLGEYDYALNTDLVKLRQDFTQNPSVVNLTVRVQLISARNNQVMRAREFSITEPAPENTPYGGVIAANRAMDKLLKKIVHFCLR